MKTTLSPQAEERFREAYGVEVRRKRRVSQGRMNPNPDDRRHFYLQHIPGQFQGPYLYMESAKP